MSDELILMIDGKPHRGWTSLTVGRSIERGPHEFEVSLTDRWGRAEAINPRSIVAGMPVQVYVNDARITSGYIDDVDPQYDATQHSLAVRGRSKLGDLVDCSTEGQQFPRMSLLGIATQLCAPFGISVAADTSVASEAGAVFNSPQTLDLGQPIWEFLEELARIRAVLLTSTADGNLLITRAGTGTADVALALGKNIKAASGSFSHRELFSDYIVTAQQPGTPTLTGTDTSQPKGTAKGSGRYRPFVVRADSTGDIADCRTRAEWQRNVHYGRSRGIVYTISGWRQTPGGRLWTPNEMVAVKDPWSGIDTELLIVESRIRLGEEGSTTENRVMPREAFDVLPLPESSEESWA
jgi:prophage tail gpP-like protein